MNLLKKDSMEKDNAFESLSEEVITLRNIIAEKDKIINSLRR